MRCVSAVLLIAGLSIAAPAEKAAAMDVIDLRDMPAVHGDVAAGHEKAQVCNNCHGADGKAPVPNFPSVAGLPEGYLYWKLVAFKETQRSDSIMTPLVSNNTLEDLRDIAAFYASLPLDAPSPLKAEPVDADVLERGQQLYLSGDPQKGIPPCQGCHGRDGKGPNNMQAFQENWPPLYGQQAMYVRDRLNQYHDRRAIDSSFDKIMEGVATHLSPDDIHALAAYVERLDSR